MPTRHKTLFSYQCFVPYPEAAVPHSLQGSLSGLTFGVKDLFDVAGYPTGCGSPHMLALSGIKAANADVVDRLLAAGAQFSGKTHSDELAFSMVGKNVHFGIPVNGAAPDRVCGGSSSGSASAVSNNLCNFAIGTDTGGSVRAPASHCGLFGLRPTHGRVSLQGCMPLSPSLDTCGWFGRDAKTLVEVGCVLLGENTGPRPGRWRILVPRKILADVRPHVSPVFSGTLRQVAERLGAKIYQEDLTSVSLDEICNAFRYIQGYEAWLGLGDLVEEHQFQLGETVRERFAWSKTVTKSQYDAAMRVRAKFQQEIDTLLGADTLLVMPTMPDVAPLKTTPDNELDAYRFEAIRLLCVSGLSGCPQVTAPIMQIDGTPLGLSLLGPRNMDLALLSVACQVST
ncbi:amidase [Caballeronia sordidicola]|nr:amidase [Caballeronia sordidicola]